MFVQEICADLLWLQEADCAEARPYVILQTQGSRQGLPPPVLQVPGRGVLPTTVVTNQVLTKVIHVGAHHKVYC
jgi:hypothetical protein